MKFRERVEESVVVWLLSTLLTGFLAGLATYRGAQAIFGLEPSSKETRERLEEKVRQLSEELAGQRKQHQEFVVAANKTNTDLGACNEQLGSSRRAMQEAASCKSALVAAQKSTQRAGNEKPQAIPPAASKLKSVRICLAWTHDKARESLEVHRRLEAQGAVIAGKYQTSAHSFVGIIYLSPEDLAAAIAAADLLKKDFNLGNFAPGTINNNSNRCQIAVNIG